VLWLFTLIACDKDDDDFIIHDSSKQQTEVKRFMQTDVGNLDLWAYNIDTNGIWNALGFLTVVNVKKDTIINGKSNSVAYHCLKL